MQLRRKKTLFNYHINYIREDTIVNKITLFISLLPLKSYNLISSFKLYNAVVEKSRVKKKAFFLFLLP
jgi:hypothetical protein